MICVIQQKSLLRKKKKHKPPINKKNMFTRDSDQSPKKSTVRKLKFEPVKISNSAMFTFNDRV